MKRSVNIKRNRQNKILIFCQGKTEEFYFNSFPVSKQSKDWHISVIIESHALDPKQLVEKAIVQRDEQFDRNRSTYNTVWCIFDKDDFKSNFREGIELADDENIRIAYSIESFELWILLHYQNVSIDSKLDRNDYIQELKKKNRLPGYDKNGNWLKENITYSKLNSLLKDAMYRSKELERKSKINRSSFSKQNCTIHRVVTFLDQIK
jgi:hypothetical protein